MLVDMRMANGEVQRRQLPLNSTQEAFSPSAATQC